MKTLFLFENGHETAFFFELAGDYSRLSGVFINAVPPKKGSGSKFRALQGELEGLVWKENSGELLPEKLEAPTKDWDFFVHCGFLD